jgi:hypothetical protein
LGSFGNFRIDSPSWTSGPLVGYNAGHRRHRRQDRNLVGFVRSFSRRRRCRCPDAWSAITCRRPRTTASTAIPFGMHTCNPDASKENIPYLIVSLFFTTRLHSFRFFRRLDRHDRHNWVRATIQRHSHQSRQGAGGR